MNISKVSITLTSEDVLSIINDFIKVNGLTINDVKINESLEIQGEFRKVLSLGFKISAELIGITDNKLRIKLIKANLMSIGILKPFRKLALKIGLKGFKEQGILVSGDEIIIDMNIILKKIPFINLSLDKIEIKDNRINTEINSIDISLNKINDPKLEVKVDEEIDNEVGKDDYIMNIEVNKVEDSYTNSREYVSEHMPDKAKPYKDYIMFIPDIAALILRLFKDKRVPIKTKVVLGICFSYISLPFDIIPDKFPIIGSLDDITVFFFALNRIIADVPMDIILENWQGKNEFVIVLKNLVEFLTSFTGAQNLDNVYGIIDSLVTD